MLFVLIGILVLIMAACGQNEASNTINNDSENLSTDGKQEVNEQSNSGKTDGDQILNLDLFVEAFTNEGIEIDKNEKPLFSMIGAKDGIIFYVENQPVKIYEFDSEKAMEEAEETLPAMKDWGRNGLFLLETSNEKSKEIFNNVK